MKSLYRMSAVGDCARAIGAARLGKESLKNSEYSEIIMKESSRHESWIIEDLRSLGLQIETGGICPVCLDDRHGIHVQIETPLFDLYGHMDGRVNIENFIFPLEIKAFGRFTYQDWANNKFKSFPYYKSQIACYMKAEQVNTAMYVVKNRDTGQKSLNVVGGLRFRDWDTIPFDADEEFNAIIKKLNEIEIFAQDGILVDKVCDYDEYSRCNYRYLCLPQAKEEIPIDMSIKDAVDMYKEGSKLSEDGEKLQEQAKLVLLQHMKTNNLEKTRLLGLSLSYGGFKSKQTWDYSSLKKDVTDWQKYVKSGKPYEDFRIYDKE